MEIIFVLLTKCDANLYVKQINQKSTVNTRESDTYFVIYINKKPLGYIQYTDIKNLLEDHIVIDLPTDLGKLDLFINEQTSYYTQLIPEIVKKFAQDIAYKYHKYILVDPEYSDTFLIHTYKECGFKVIQKIGKRFLMIATQKTVRLSIEDLIALEVCFKKNFLEKDHLWLFGSRTDLNKRGGDIDLYIETHKDAKESIEAENRFLNTLERQIENQKIDMVLNLLNSPTDLPIYTIAKTEGKKIV